MRRLIIAAAMAVISLCGFGHSFSQGPLGPVVAPALPQVSHAVIAWANVDTAGRPDLFLSGLDANRTPVSYLLIDSAGEFVQRSHPFPAVYNGSAGWSDLDGDGLVDLVVMGRLSDNRNITKIYRQSPLGTFTELSHNIPDLSDGEIKWADMDGDGDEDLVVAGLGGHSGEFFGIYENESSTLTKINSSNIEARRFPSFDVGDYDNDGDVDIALGGSDDSSFVHLDVWRCTGDFVYEATPYRNLPGNYNGSVDFGDLDGDGYLELLVSSAKGLSGTLILKYQPDRFSRFEVGLPDVTGKAIWADYDNDGDDDIIVSGYSSEIAGEMGLTRVYRNNAGALQHQSAFNFENVFISNIECISYQNDNAKDLVISGYSKNGRPHCLLYLFDDSQQTYTH